MDFYVESESYNSTRCYLISIRAALHWSNESLALSESQNTTLDELYQLPTTYIKRIYITSLKFIFKILILIFWLISVYHCNSIWLLIFDKRIIGPDTTANFTSLSYCSFVNAIVSTYRQSTIQIYIVTRFIFYILQPYKIIIIVILFQQ